MGWIEDIATLCGYISVILALLGTVWKLSKPLKDIVQRLDRVEQYQHNDYLCMLRLTIMAEEMPMEERLTAGEKYVKPFRKEADLVLNGNSDLKYFAQILEYIYTITNNFQ